MPHALPHRLIDNPAVQDNFEDIEEILQEPGAYTDKNWPKNPTDGQVINYANAAMESQETRWQLRYRTTLANWEFVGGPRYASGIEGQSRKIKAKAEIAVAGGPTLIVPRAGLYHVTIAAYMGNEAIESGTANEIALTLRKNGVATGNALNMLYCAVSWLFSHQNISFYFNLSKGDSLSCGFTGPNNETTEAGVEAVSIELEPHYVG